MPEISLTGVLVVAAVAFTVPFLLGLAPGLRLPAVVLEIVVGVAIGPSGLGVVEVDMKLEILALLGLAFLLFLAGLEIDLARLVGGPLGVAALGFAVSLAIAFVIALGLGAAGVVRGPLLVAIVLSATALGIIVPVLADARQTGTPLGQLIIAAGSIADFGAILLLSVLFSRETTSLGSRLVLIGVFVLLVVAAGVALAGIGRFSRFQSVLLRLQDSSSQIRVRGAFVLLVGLAVLAQLLGLEVILGAFFAGAMLRLLDRDEVMTHTGFHTKLQAVGFGVFIPVFFVTSGMELELGALFEGGGAVLLVPVLLVALLLSRGLPAFLYRSRLGNRGAVAAGLLQATSLPFIVAATEIGGEIGELDPATGAALVVAGLLSVVLFPLTALTLLRTAESAGTRDRMDTPSTVPGREP